MKKCVSKKKAYSIKTAMILAFSIIAIGALTIALIAAYMFTIEEVRVVSVDYMSQLITQVNNDIDRYTAAVEDVADVVTKNSMVLRWVRDGGSMSQVERLVLEDDIQRWLASILSTREDISNVAIFDGDGRVLFDSREKMLNPFVDFEQSDWYKGALKEVETTYISSSHVQNIVLGRYDWMVTMSKPITLGSGEALGVLMIDLNYNTINNLCKSVNLGNRGYIYVLDRDGNIVYHPQQQLIYAGIREEYLKPTPQTDVHEVRMTSVEDKVYLLKRSPITEWTVVGAAYQNELISNQGRIISFYLVILEVFIVVALFIATFIFTAVTNPLNRLVKHMNAVRPGSLHKNIQIDNPKEVALLSTAFNDMTTQIDESIRQRDKEQEQRRISELNALQAQINPHFLYNTLDSIIWMAENDNSEEVVEMTAALARLFRSSVSQSGELVPLSTEIANIRSYLTIQQMRYKEKLRYFIDIPPEMNLYQLPKLLLQPLVENAIYHGIKPRDTGGMIWVRGRVEDEFMILEVEDDGVGMPPDRIKEVFSEEREYGGNSIGLKNVHDRVVLTYGGRYGLFCESEEGKGTLIRIVLPKQEGGEQQ